MQLTLAVVVFCACVAVTVQQVGPGGHSVDPDYHSDPGGPSNIDNRAPGSGPSDMPSDYPSDPRGPSDYDVGPPDSGAPYMPSDPQGPSGSGSTKPPSSGQPGRADGAPGSRSSGGNKPPGTYSGNKEYPDGASRRWEQEDKEESTQKSGVPQKKMEDDSMEKMDGSKLSPPAGGIHMKFEFNLGADFMAGLAGQGRDMEEQGGNGGDKDGEGGNGGDKDGKGGKMDVDDRGKGNKMDGMTGAKSGKDMDMKNRPHRPIICRINASGMIVKRECPYKLVCGGGRGIRQGGWTMYFCHYDKSMQQVSEFDYPDEDEVFGKSADVKDEGDMKEDEGDMKEDEGDMKEDEDSGGMGDKDAVGG